MTHSKPALPLWLRLTLFGSLSLNLAVIGLIIGLAVTWHGPERRPAALAAAGGAYTHALRGQDRHALMRKLRRDTAPAVSRQDARASFEAVLAALRAEPFDAAALQTAMAEQHRLFSRRAEQGQAVLVAHLISLDAAERAAYADRLAAHLDRRRP